MTRIGLEDELVIFNSIHVTSSEVTSLVTCYSEMESHSSNSTFLASETGTTGAPKLMLRVFKEVEVRSADSQFQHLPPNAEAIADQLRSVGEENRERREESFLPKSGDIAPDFRISSGCLQVCTVTFNDSKPCSSN